MQGEKLHCAAEAVTFAVRNMHADDRLSLTIYDDHVQTLVPSAPVSHAGPQILALLPRIQAGNCTALHDAWVQGGLQVSEHLEPGRVHRVLLVSDGLANVGETRSGVLIDRARELYAKGISTSTVGVGKDFNEDLMIPMAREGGGNGWFVESPADFTRIFRCELEDLAAVFGEKARLRLEPRGRRVEILEVLNDFQRDTDSGSGAARPGAGACILGTLFGGSPLEIVARVKVQGGELHQPLDLFDVRLSWEVPGDGRSEMTQLVRMECDDPAKVAALQPSADVSRAVELLESARIRRRAVMLMDAGQFEVVQAMFRDQKQHWAAISARSADPEARLELDEFDNLVAVADRAATDPAARALARKCSSYQAHERLFRSRRPAPKKQG